jgi:phosphohistidine phosphatase SixA
MRLASCILVLGSMLATRSGAQPPMELVTKLQQGGYVLVMRHAHSPSAPPQKADVDPTNLTGERQLDEVGKFQAREFGRAATELHIRFAQVLTSPAFRARETVRLAGITNPSVVPALAMSEQQTMMTTAPTASGEQLRVLASKSPSTGSNLLIVTHLPNILAAFPKDSDAFADGDVLVLRPLGGTLAVIGRIKAGEWDLGANRSARK